jgi:hypothetical protein
MDTKVTFSAAQNTKEDAGVQRGRADLGEIGLRNFAPYLMNRIMGRYNRSLREVEGRSFHPQGADTRGSIRDRRPDGQRARGLYGARTVDAQPHSRCSGSGEAHRREAPAKDTRVRHIFITEGGRKAFDAMWPFMRDSSLRATRGTGSAVLDIAQGLRLEQWPYTGLSRLPSARSGA